MAESNNKFRLSKFLTDGGTYFAKELLKEEFSNAGFTDISAFLNDAAVKRKLHGLHTRRILHQSQMDLLYPASGTANIDDLDITLLTCILTNCFKLSASKQTTIAELRTIRNEFLGHTASYQLADNHFKQQWQKVASFLESESNTYLSPDCVKTITGMRKTIEGEILTSGVAEKYYHELRVYLEEKTRLSEERELKNQVKLDQIGGCISRLERLEENTNEKQINRILQRIDEHRRNESLGSQLNRQIISSTQNKSKYEKENGDLNANDSFHKHVDHQFIGEKIIAATAKIRVVEEHKRMAADIGEILYKKKIDELTQTLKRDKILVLVGLPGSGKTFTALTVMSEICDEDAKPVVVGTLDDLKKVVDPKQKLVILVDDVLGQFSLDNVVVNEWNDIADLLIEHIWSSNSYFIFTSRRSIYKSATSNYVCESIFKNYVVIDEKTFMKENLLQFYTRRKHITLSEIQRQAILATQQFAIGFPVLCSHMNGTFETVIDLFTRPYLYIEQEIQALCDNGDPQYVVLLLTLLQGNLINTQNIDKGLLDTVRCTHCFVDEGNEIQNIAESMVGTYLRKVGENISFLHNCILESILKVGIQESREILISHLTFENVKHLFGLLKDEMAQPYNSVLKEILPTLVKKRGKEFLSKDNSAAFLTSELAEYKAKSEEFDHIVKHVLELDQRYSNGRNLLHIAAATGKVEAIKYILKLKPDLMHSTDERGWNALHYATEIGSVTALNFLIEPLVAMTCKPNPSIVGISPDTRTAGGDSILHIAAEQGNTELVKYILQNHKELTYITNDKGWNVLHCASKMADTEMIEILMQSELEPIATTINGSNILHIAARNGNNEVVEYIIENYKDLIQAVDVDGSNALHCATEKHSVDIIKALIEAGLSPETKKTDGSNILHIAVCTGNMDIVRYVIENHKDLIHTVDNNGWNALHVASGRQSIEMVKLLIEAGLKPESRTRDGFDILHIAAGNGNIEVVRYIIENYKDLFQTVATGGFNALHFATAMQSAEMMKVLIEEAGLKSETRTTDGRNILHIAICNENIEVVRYVIENYKDIIQNFDNDGLNTLHVTTAMQAVDTLKGLIGAGLSPELMTKDGGNILQYAVINGNTEMVKYIIENYKDLIYSVCYDGWNALHIASQKQNVDMLMMLIEAGLKPETTKTNGANILHIAASNGNIEVVRYVTENYKELIHTVDNDGWNALHLASQKQSILIIKLLIEAGLKPETTKGNGANILHIAASNGNMEVVRYITETYKDLIHTVSDNGWSALHCTSQKQNVALLKVLIEAGLKPETRQTDGRNILHIAASNGNMEVVRYITENYKDLIHTVDNGGCNALHLASGKQNVALLNVLIEAGLKPETRQTDGSNILHIAASNGNMEVVRYVTENYKDLIQTVDNNGWNALHLASGKQNVALLNVLIEAGLKPDTTKTNGSNILHIAASNGNVEVVRYVTEIYKDLIDTVDNDGQNALHYASWKQSVDLVKMLIDAGLKPETMTTDGSNILHIAAGNGNMEVVRYITENYKDLIHTVDNDGWNALHLASCKQNVDLLNMLIEAGLKPYTTKTDGANILHIAASNGNMEVVRYVTETYKDLIHTVSDNGWSALHCTSQKQNVALLKVLIEAGLKPETRQTDGHNILHIAASNGNMEVVRYVTENYKDLIDTVDNDGRNALHYASWKQSVDLVKMLIDAGLKPETMTTDGSNILHIAAGNGNMEVVSYITENYKDLIHTVINNGWNALHLASHEQNVALLKVLIEAGLKPETRQTDGNNILHIAASNGNMEVVRYITENYKDLIHTVDNGGCNALHLASGKQNVALLNVLIEAGLEADTTKTNGSNILHIAASNRNMEVVRYVIENYTELIHTVDNNGSNALHLASGKQNVALLNVLIEAGLKPDTRKTDGSNVLHIAASNGNMEVVRYVTEIYKDLIDTVDNDGRNALHYASWKQSVDLVKMLIDAGLNPETMTTDGSNILHIAAGNGNMEVVRYVTENYKDLIHTVDDDGWNAVHLASCKQNIDLLNVLIEAGLKPDTTKSDGRNILHIAASNGNMEVVRYITEHYKDLIHTVDNDGWNALHLASCKQNVDLLNMLIEAGLKPYTTKTDGANILHIAASNGNMEVVRYITENYKDLIHTVSDNGWSALHCTSQKQNVALLKVLIEAGLKPETRQTDGHNILHIAAINGNMEVVRYVTENYKDLIDTVINSGWNALHLASQKQNVALLKELIEAGLKPETRIRDGSNILHIAASNGNMDVVRYVTENYKDLIHTVDDNESNALHLASGKQNVALLKVLIEAGLNSETRITDGSNILHIAAGNGNLEIVRYITENYKDLIHTVNNNGWNALHLASGKQNVALLIVLIKAGLKPETRKTDGSNILHIAASNGNIEVVRYVTENYKDLIHTVYNDGWNALHIASCEQNVDLLIVLIEAGLKPETRKTDGSNILLIAASNGNIEVVRYVTENYKDLIHTVDNDGWNALHNASSKQNVALLKVLIEAGLNSETRLTDGSNILHIAAGNGNLEIVRYITENYKDLIHTVNNNGWNALHLASGKQNVALLIVLIKAGLKPETRKTDGSNILHIAASNGNIEVVRYITENYKDLIHTVDNGGWNALHLASQKQNVDLLIVLIEAGLKPEITKTNGSNILNIAASNGNMEVVRYVTENYKDLIHTVDNNGSNALHLASGKQNVALLNVLIEAGLKPDTTKTNGSNILHIAASNGNIEVVRYVTENYKDLIHTVDNDGWNALHLASGKQNVALLKELIEAGLNSETRITDGSNILHIAVSNGNLEIVRYITENYKDLIHTVDNNGWNALHLASQKQNVDLLIVLIEAGLKPETRKTNGSNILHIAASNGNMEVVRYVTESYKDLIHTVDNNGSNALHLASGKQNVALLKVLIEAGLKPDTRKKDGSNILHIAASNGNIEVVRYVTENYKDLIHTVYNDGWNALHIASCEQNVDLLIVLIEAGLKPETRKTDGSNILLIAASNGNIEVVRYVTENYKDLIHTVDNDGWNALHNASGKQNVALLKVLIEAGLNSETRLTDGSNILHISAGNGNLEIVRYITENYKDLIHTVNNNGWNALHLASGKQNVALLIVLLKAGLKPETRKTDGSNILHIAACNGNIEVVRYVTENYKDLIHTVYNDGWNALHIASQKQNVAFLKVLIEAGLKPETRKTDGSNILHIAASNGNMEVVNYVIENYTGLIHTVENNGQSVLHFAARGGSKEMVNLLIEAGCDPYATISDISNILHLLAYHKDFDTINCILKDNPRYRTLHLSQEYVDFFVASGVNAEIRTCDGGNILHIAASNGNYEVVKFICANYNSLINTVDINGWNALSYSSVRSSVEQFKYLISIGEEPRDTVDGDNAFLLAAVHGNRPIVEYIAEHLHRLLKTSNIKGENALHCASNGGYIDTFTYLISLGEDPWEETKEDKNVLHIALEKDRLEMVKYICQQYPDMLTSRGRDGWSCLHHAAKYSSVSVLDYLIDAGLSTGEETLDGRNLLEIAVEFGNIDLIMYIKEKGWF